MRKPLVSVIVIVKNGEKYIESALHSIIKQTYQNIEVLVVDGGSSDRTLDIASDFPSIKILQQPDEGIPNAYNFGIKHSKGKLISFLSHDDLWASTKLEKQVDAFEQSVDLDYCITDVKYEIEPGAKIPTGFRTELLDKPVKGFMMESLVVRKEIYDKIGYYDTALSVGEDTDWFFRCIDHDLSYVHLKQVLVIKRIHETNAHLTDGNINKIILKAAFRSIQRKKSSQ